MNSMIGHTGYSGKRGTGDIVPKGYQVGQLQQFTPEQQRLFKQSFSYVKPNSYLSRLAGGDEGLFEEMEAPALRQFGELQGNLASRFSGMGMGSRRSSGFQNVAGQQASDFAQQLQANRMGLQRQALKDLFEISELLLGQRPKNRFLAEKPQSQSTALGGWGGALGALGGGALGFMAGGPAGAMTGASLGSQAFSGL